MKMLWSKRHGRAGRGRKGWYVYVYKKDQIWGAAGGVTSKR
jgi:hypothetical protein